jgi:hypothetical protein
MRHVSSGATAFSDTYTPMGRKPAATALDSIAYRLRISRIALGYTPTTISRLINSPSSLWHNFEAGTRRISVDKALALKRATGLTLEWIYTGDITSLPREIAAKIDTVLRTERGLKASSG